MKNKATVKVLTPKAPAVSIVPEVRHMLTALGEDPLREGLLRTPERVDKAMKFLTSGYHIDIDKVVNGAIFAEKYDEMVIVKDVSRVAWRHHCVNMRNVMKRNFGSRMLLRTPLAARGRSGWHASFAQGAR